ncbi:hypothetical protein KUCAC02_030445 [Chaenocephalus aceratus]|uniref:Uncharacterized protein n=1 Tax=Chaenocephalus aceratus TaxID=36190 RepID=A0ACB9XIV6_CHAAC|nr:hypothetical protein KUCAC02_030445 [Chaenocephalus aceratus]
MSKRKLNQSVSLAHFGFTSKKVTPRDDQETPRDDADDAAASTALATRTVSESGAPVPPSHSPEGGEVEAERSEDAAVAEVAATASDFPPAGWTTKQDGNEKKSSQGIFGLSSLKIEACFEGESQLFCWDLMMEKPDWPPRWVTKSNASPFVCVMRGGRAEEGPINIIKANNRRK